MSKIVITIILIVILSVGTFGFFIIKENIDRSNICKDNSIRGKCSIPAIDCFNDCKYFEKEYFRMEYGFTIASEKECWCELNGELEQIW